MAGIDNGRERMSRGTTFPRSGTGFAQSSLRGGGILGAVIVVQVITITWTKASRGAPGAVERAAVAEVAPVPSAGTAPVLVHEVEAHESAGFAVIDRGTRAPGPLPIDVAGVRLDDRDGVVAVTRMATTRDGWPPRPYDRPAFRLESGQWGRLLRNSRHSDHDGWRYSKVIMNVGNLAGVRTDAFTGDPVATIDEQAALW